MFWGFWIPPRHPHTLFPPFFRLHVQHLPTMPSDIFHAISFFKMPIDTLTNFKMFWVDFTVQWIMSHGLKNTGLEIIILSPTDQKCHGMLLPVALWSSYFSMIFTSSFLKVGLSSWVFSLLACTLTPFSSSLLFSRMVKVTCLKEALFSLAKWRGAQVILHVAWGDFSFAISVLTSPLVPVVLNSNIGYFLPTKMFFSCSYPRTHWNLAWHGAPGACVQTSCGVCAFCSRLSQL